MKHKEGQQVRIIARINGHEFQINDVVTIVELEKPRTLLHGHYKAERADGVHWWINDEECEAVPERVKELEEALKMARQYVFAWKVKDIQPLLGEDLDADLQKIDDLLSPQSKTGN